MNEIKTTTTVIKQNKKKNKNKARNRAKKNTLKGLRKQFSKQVVINNTTSRQRVNPSGKVFNKSSARSLYVQSVMHPELKMQARVPSLFALPTIASQQISTINFTVGATGNFNFVYRPVYACDPNTITGNRSTFYYNPSCNFDGVTTGGYAVGPIQPAVPENIASAYRLVSASIVMYVNSQILTMKGRMGIAIHTDNYNGTPVLNTTTGTFSISSPEFNSIAISQNSMHYSECAVTPGVALRAIYLPFDPSFLHFLPINAVRSTLTTTAPDEFFFIGYGAGLNVGDNIQFRIYLNYEFEPHGSSFPLSLSGRSQEKGSAESAISGVAQSVNNATNVASSDTSPYANINAAIQQAQNNANADILYNQGKVLDYRGAVQKFGGGKTFFNSPNFFNGSQLANGFGSMQSGFGLSMP